jgi:hypothetical protein
LRSHMQQQRLDRTALRVQQIMQAAMAFHVAENHWPSTATQPEFSVYLPQGGIPSNAWGYAFELTHPNRIRLGVRTRVPIEALARQLAARLPNASVASQDHLWSVQAEMTVPGQSSAFNSSLQVLRMAQLTGLHDGEQRRINDLACDGTLQMLTSITGFFPRIENFTGGDPIARLAVNSRCGSSSCTLSVVNQEEINLHHPESNGTVDVQYLVLCALLPGHQR